MLAFLFAGLSAMSCKALGDNPFELKILQHLFEQYQRKQACDYANQFLNELAGDPYLDSCSDSAGVAFVDAITRPSLCETFTNDAQGTADPPLRNIAG